MTAISGFNSPLHAQIKARFQGRSSAATTEETGNPPPATRTEKQPGRTGSIDGTGRIRSGS